MFYCTRKFKSALHTLALALLFGGGMQAKSQVLYSEDFNSASDGQSLTTTPINWLNSPYGDFSDFTGDVFAGPTTHPGWVGNAIVGSLSSSKSGNQAHVFLPNIPTTG